MAELQKNNRWRSGRADKEKWPNFYDIASDLKPTRWSQQYYYYFTSKKFKNQYYMMILLEVTF